MYLLSLATLLTTIFIVFYLLNAVLRWRVKSINLMPTIIDDLLRRYAMHLAFLVALVSTLGSLYFSELQGLAPCLLCWYQRIFMYPLVFIVIIGILTKDRSVTKYILPLVGIGGLIAMLHVYIQTFPTSFIACTFNDVSCSDNYFTYFGFVTIPVMSLVSFVVVGLFTLIGKTSADSNQT